MSRSGSRHEQHAFGVIPAEISQFQIMAPTLSVTFVLDDLVDGHDSARFICAMFP